MKQTDKEAFFAVVRKSNKKLLTNKKQAVRVSTSEVGSSVLTSYLLPGNKMIGCIRNYRNNVTYFINEA
jgi:hypothetical protein